MAEPNLTTIQQNISTFLDGFLPEDWKVTHLIQDGDCWQVIANNDEYCATATGGDIEDALTYLTEKVLSRQFTGRIFDGFTKLRTTEAEPTITNLAAALGFKREEVKRRV